MSNSKWKERKFWLAVLAFGTGTAAMVCGILGIAGADQWIRVAELVGGSLVNILVLGGWIRVEGELDATRILQQSSEKKGE